MEPLRPEELSELTRKLEEAISSFYRWSGLKATTFLIQLGGEDFKVTLTKGKI